EFCEFVLGDSKLPRPTNELGSIILESLNETHGGLSVLADLGAGHDGGQRVDPGSIVGNAPASVVVNERLICVGNGIAVFAQTHPRQTSTRIRIGVFRG